MKPSVFLILMLLLPVVAAMGAYMAARLFDRLRGQSLRLQLAVIVILASLTAARAVRAWWQQDSVHALVLIAAACTWLLVPVAQRLGRAHHQTGRS